MKRGIIIVMLVAFLSTFMFGQTEIENLESQIKTLSNTIDGLKRNQVVQQYVIISLIIIILGLFITAYLLFRKYSRSIQQKMEKKIKVGRAADLFSRAFYTDNAEEEIYLYSLVIDLTPDYADAFINRGLIYLKFEEFDKAISDFDRAIEIDINKPNAYYNRGLAYSDLKLHDKAIADYTKTIELDPEDSQAYYNRGNEYLDLEEIALAFKDYDKALELDLEYVDAYFNRGIIYTKTGDYEKAIADYKEALELKEDDYEILDNMANTYRMMKEYDKAISHAKKSMKINSDNSYSYGTLAEIYSDMNDTENFYKYLELALQKDYPLLEVINEDENIKAIYDRHTNEDRFRKLMGKKHKPMK